MSVLKRKDFTRWQAGEKLPDAALCKAVKEMENGLIDADLGGFLYKKRVARPATATRSCTGSRRTTRPTSRRTRRRPCSSPARCFWISRRRT